MMPLDMPCPQAVEARRTTLPADSYSVEVARLAEDSEIRSFALRASLDRTAEGGCPYTALSAFELCSARSLLIGGLRFAGAELRVVPGLRARGESTLGQEVHGAVDGNVDGAGILVDVAVGAENIFFAQAIFVQFGALVGFQLRRGKILLADIFRSRRLRNLFCTPAAGDGCRQARSRRAGSPVSDWLENDSPESGTSR